MLLMVLFCVGYLAGCSAEELLTEVPGTMQIQQEITETTQTEDENAQTESDTEQAEEEEEEKPRSKMSLADIKKKLGKK